ncbi:hypothetical protein KIPB_011137 [Kipferlia bialata]|uniref:Uncharacterized protein n=1 Tax=Kipferlia bialata TaxID=797122 RepID=A0A9K3D494_9EUKA|nr:hypothetical protein KIPB_011137 [Kipferlia bialata]|eukprot:g11137.t1
MIDSSLVPSREKLFLFCRHFMASCIMALSDDPDPLMEVSEAEWKVCERWKEEGKEVVKQAQASGAVHTYWFEACKAPTIIPTEIWFAFDAGSRRTNTPEWAGPEKQIRRMREVCSVDTIRLSKI